MIKQNIVALATLGLLTISASAVNTTVCAGCHGKNFEKKSMNVSKIVKDMSKEDIVKALKGYKDGSYGHSPMKGVMAGQAKNLSDADIEEIATSIAGGDKKAEDANATKAEDKNATKTEDANTTKVEDKNATKVEETNATKAEDKKEAVPAKKVDTVVCAGCHGANFEKVALGKSKIVKDMTKADIEKALKGYKDGSYGGAMKAVMAPNAKKLSDEDIKAIAEKFGK